MTENYFEEAGLTVIPQGRVEVQTVAFGLEGRVTLLAQLAPGDDGLSVSITVGGSPYDDAEEARGDIAQILETLAEVVAPDTEEATDG